MTKDQFAVFYSDTMETCSNMKFNTKLFDLETLVQYNPSVSTSTLGINIAVNILCNISRQPKVSN